MAILFLPSLGKLIQNSAHSKVVFARIITVMNNEYLILSTDIRLTKMQSLLENNWHQKPFFLVMTQEVWPGFLYRVPQLFSWNNNFFIFIILGHCINIEHSYASECDSYSSSQTMQCMNILTIPTLETMNLIKFSVIDLHWCLYFTLMHSNKMDYHCRYLWGTLLPI